uniref:Uncharacterized protein n=1 Tax=Yersinia pseudotuberculosis serotype O:3 (strain YPIII) TaxID=502800 RepID=A0A0H3B6Z2_YERPY
MNIASVSVTSNDEGYSKKLRLSPRVVTTTKDVIDE